MEEEQKELAILKTNNNEGRIPWCRKVKSIPKTESIKYLKQKRNRLPRQLKPLVPNIILKIIGEKITFWNPPSTVKHNNQQTHHISLVELISHVSQDKYDRKRRDFITPQGCLGVSKQMVRNKELNQIFLKKLAQTKIIFFIGNTKNYVYNFTHTNGRPETR